MKKLFSFFLVAGLAFTMQAQDITNKLSATGNFKVDKNDGTTNLFTLSETGDHLMSFSGADKGFTIYNSDDKACFKFHNDFGFSDLSRLAIGVADNFWLGPIDFPDLLLQGGINGPNNFSMVARGASDNEIYAYRALGDESAADDLDGTEKLLEIATHGYFNDAYRHAASIIFQADGAPAGTSPNGFVPAKIVFETGTNAALPVERMTIKNDGKVGVGTTTPNSTMHVNGSLSLPVYQHAPIGNEYIVTDTDYTIISEATGQTITLPDPAGIIGRIYVVKKALTAGDTIIQSSGDDVKIDGADQLVINQAWQFVELQAATSKAWIVIGAN